MAKKTPRQKEKNTYRHRRRRKIWKKRYNRFKNSLRKEARHDGYEKFTQAELTIKVPPNFSLLTHPEEVLKFASKCKELVHGNHRKLFFDFSKVVDVTHGSMSMLLSIIHDLSLHGIGVGGGYPINEKAKEIFEKCGFLEFFITSRKKVLYTDNTILVQGGATIDQERTAPQVASAMNTVFGQPERNQKLQGMIIELMTNSVNHAFAGTRRNKKWYLSVYHLEEEKKVKFCFVDNGLGILSTINMKYFTQMLQSAILPERMLRKAFDGDYGSSTGLKERGTGLIMVKRNFEEGRITNLKVITNNFFYDFDLNHVKKIKNEFEGTFYFWELDTSCKNGNYQNKRF